MYYSTSAVSCAPSAHHSLCQPSTKFTSSSFHQKSMCTQHRMNLVTLLRNWGCPERERARDQHLRIFPFLSSCLPFSFLSFPLPFLFFWFSLWGQDHLICPLISQPTPPPMVTSSLIQSTLSKQEWWQNQNVSTSTLHYFSRRAYLYSSQIEREKIGQY